jgi:hypothetical protein
MENATVLKSIESESFTDAVESALEDLRKRADYLPILTTYIECGKGISVVLVPSCAVLPAAMSRDVIHLIADRLWMMAKAGRFTNVIYNANEKSARLDLSFS